MIVVNGGNGSGDFGGQPGGNRTLTPRRDLYYYQKP